MLTIFIVWSLILVTALVFSRESADLWRKIFSIEINELVRSKIFYVSLGLSLLLLGLSFYFFTLVNTFILIGLSLIWSIFVKAIISILSKFP